MPTGATGSSKAGGVRYFRHEVRRAGWHGLAIVVSTAARYERAATSMESSAKRGARREWPVAAHLFAFFTLLYAWCAVGRFNSTDGRDIHATAVSLLLRHSLAVPPSLGTFVGRGGLSYAKYGIGLSLVEFPLTLVDLAGGALGLFRSAPDLFASMTNAWVTAAGIALLFLLVRDLGYGARVALLTALVYGLTTPAWPYAKLDFSEPLLATMLLAAALASFRFATRQRQQLLLRLRWVLLAGAALGVAVLTKYVAVAVAPLFAIYLIAASQGGEAERATAPPRWRRSLPAQAAFWLPVAAAVALTLAVNALRSGSPWVTGYAAFERPLNQSPLATLAAGAALLVSPGFGLLWYASPLVLGVLGFRRMWRRHPREALGVALLAGVTLLLYATYPTWYGGWSWGPRFLVPLAPFLLLPAAEIFADPPVARRLRNGMLALLAAGGVEQVLGVLVNYRADYDLLPWARPETAHVWEPWTAALLWHALFLPVSLLTNLGLRLPGRIVPVTLANWGLNQVAEFFPFFWCSLFPAPLLALLAGSAIVAYPLWRSGRALYSHCAGRHAPQTERPPGRGDTQS